ncbi:YggS family pyridoxal phosphate-dependent enzyme [bacterium]|nr:YggS family pyridoxal phosphate-dependent enzyme [bacterium]
MNHHSADEVAHQFESIRRRIDAVERPWTDAVEITAVTKAFAPTVVDTAVEAGCTVIGENYAQDLLSKRAAIECLVPHRRPRVDFIGHLQSNKVRQLVGLVDRWCTIDRSSIAKEIANRAPGAEVLLQVNATGEENKGGCRPDDVAALQRQCVELGLVVAGLLAIGPTGLPAEDAAPGFRLVRSLVDDLGLAVCSMGMTGDLDVAVACGSTNVRIGSLLFGARPAPVHQEGDGRG